MPSIKMISLLLFSLMNSALSTEVQGTNFCDGPFALCAYAHCTTVPGNSSLASCPCEGPFTGLNLGNSSCAARSQNFLSTFSILQQFTQVPIRPQLYSFECDGSNAAPWASCLDAPCSVDNGFISCTCPIMSASPNLWFGTKCPTSQQQKTAFCKTLRSSAQPNVFAMNEATFYGFYGQPPSVKPCPI